MRNQQLRNFSIIAHIDHGKSTLADRILEKTGALSAREMKAQVLDKMDIERERGITIKSQAVHLNYTAKNGDKYEFNLIDTPGHVDFGYEVSRSLSACEGALLLVDASQGVEAQTLANVFLAIENDLTIIPIINKIDLPSADIERVKEEIEEVIGIDASEAILTSAKSGEGVDELLEAIVDRIPPPNGPIKNESLRALIFDSWFDAYRGIVVLCRVMNGRVKAGQTIKLMHSKKEFQVGEVGAFTPHHKKQAILEAGDVGFIIANIKNVGDARVGDTITGADNPAHEPVPGFRSVKPMVFAGVFPTDNNAYEALKDALNKLALNDAALTFEPETSEAIGFGFRCGFLGLLHMEIVQERLEREFDLDLLTTAPTVVYKAALKNGDIITIDSPAKMPDPTRVEYLEEPFVRASIHTPQEYVGSLIKICEERRGLQKKIDYVTEKHVVLEYILPLSEIVFDFFDKLKTLSRGYASLDYEIEGFKKSKLVKVDILLNGQAVDALSIVVHRDSAQHRGRAVCEKMKELIPRQQFQIAIQSAIGGKIIARETVSALRKDVTAKCYGGDISRKRKLLEKQKKGKKRMRQIGNVEVPQAAFLSILKID